MGWTTITIVNRSSRISDAVLRAYVLVLQQFINTVFIGQHGGFLLQVTSGGRTPEVGGTAWTIDLVDTEMADGARGGAHWAIGEPRAICYISGFDSWMRCLSHEIFEMIENPFVNKMSRLLTLFSDGRKVWNENCDVTNFDPGFYIGEHQFADFLMRKWWMEMSTPTEATWARSEAGILDRPGSIIADGYLYTEKVGGQFEFVTGNLLPHRLITSHTRDSAPTPPPLPAPAPAPEPDPVPIPNPAPAPNPQPAPQPVDITNDRYEDSDGGGDFGGRSPKTPPWLRQTAYLPPEMIMYELVRKGREESVESAMSYAHEYEHIRQKLLRGGQTNDFPAAMTLLRSAA